MTAAREKIDGVLRHMQQREDKQRQAKGAWERSKARCIAIAQALLEGTGAQVSVLDIDGSVWLTAKHGACARFSYDAQQLALIGTRGKSAGASEPFFSLKIEPPARPQGYAQGQWGPSRPDGIGDISAKVGTQEAFEKAVADWFEWAHIGDGAPPAAS